MTHKQTNKQTMKKTFLIPLIILFSFFYAVEITAQNNNECKVQLENLEINMNALEFFQKNYFEKDNTIYHTESGSPMNASQAFNEYGFTYNIYQEWLTEKDLKKDYYYEGDEEIKIAQIYYTNRFTETSKVACYNNLWFNSLQILATDADHFIALIASNKRTLKEDFETLLFELSSKTNIEKSDFKNFELYTFTFEDYAIQIKEFKQSYRSESRVAVPGEKIQPIVDIELLIISNSITEKTLNWLGSRNN